MTLTQEVAYIRPDGADFITPQSSGGDPWPSGFVTTPFELTYNTYAGPGVYDCAEQGLLVLYAHDPASPWGMYQNMAYKLVTKADGTMDAQPFFEAMSAICSFGTADEGLSHASRVATAKARPLEMRCGHVTDFARTLASSVGINTRQVHLLNVTSQNFFDDGHVALEAQIGGTWKFFDVPNDLTWHDTQGAQLSLGEIVEAGAANCTQELLAQHRVGRHNYPDVMGAYYETVLHTHDDVVNWCERVYEVPGIAAGNGIVWGLPDALSGYSGAITGYPGTGGTWSVIPLDDWIAAYY